MSARLLCHMPILKQLKTFENASYTSVLVEMSHNIQKLRVQGQNMQQIRSKPSNLQGSQAKKNRPWLHCFYCHFAGCVVGQAVYAPQLHHVSKTSRKKIRQHLHRLYTNLMQFPLEASHYEPYCYCYNDSRKVIVIEALDSL